MPRISLIPPDKARASALPAMLSGDAEAHAYCCDAESPLHLHRLTLGAGGTLRFERAGMDRLAYVWRGAIEVAGCALPAGSSMIVERNAALDVVGGAMAAEILVFSAVTPPTDGGHASLLPADRVPRYETQGGSGVSGGMHFDATLSSCPFWLHENRFPGSPPPTAEEERRGVHSHSEAEIIFVIDGQIRLGAQLHGPGTALAIGADVLYAFTAGPEGLGFVNFRAAMPSDIRFPGGTTISETGYWRERVPKPEYVTL